jgi:hypothetical protein
MVSEFGRQLGGTVLRGTVDDRNRMVRLLEKANEGVVWNVIQLLTAPIAKGEVMLDRLPVRIAELTAVKGNELFGGRTFLGVSHNRLVAGLTDACTKRARSTGDGKSHRERVE